MEEVLSAAAVCVVGVMVGVEFAVTAFLTPVLDRLPEQACLTGRSDAARVLGRVMPFWYAASIVLAMATAAVGGSVWAVVAGALLVVVTVLSLVLLVPVNNRVALWTTGSRPHDWRVQLRGWERLHVVRVGLIGLVLAFLVAA